LELSSFCKKGILPALEYVREIVKTRIKTARPTGVLCGRTECVEQSTDGAAICAGDPGLQERIEDATVWVDFVRRLWANGKRCAVNTPSSSSILKIRNECARKKDNIYQGEEKAISHAR